MPVPKDLRERVGKGEIIQSLETADPDEALAKATQLKLEWKQRFRDMRAEIAGERLAAAPEIVDRFIRAMSDKQYGDTGGAIHALKKAIAYRLMVSWGPHAYQEYDLSEIFGGVPDDDSWSVDDSDDVDIIPEEARAALVREMRLLHWNPHTFGVGYNAPIRFLQQSRRWDVLRLELLMVQEFTGTPIGHQGALYDAVAECLVERIMTFRSSQWDERLLQEPDAVSAGPVTTSSAPVMVPAPPEMVAPAGDWHNVGRRYQQTHTLTAGLQRWKESMAPGESAITETTRSVERFVELFGDKHVTQITPDDLFDYRDFLTTMPAGISLPAVKASGTTLRDHVERLHAEEAKREAEAERKGIELPAPRRLSPQSVKKDLGGLSAIFSAILSERWILTNPADKIPIDGYSKKRKVFPLKPSMMKELFESPLFTGCEGKAGLKRTRSGPHVFQDALYWSFLFGATSGHRLSEVAEALLTDVEEGIGPDGETIVGIFVLDAKNEDSRRVILVHPKLLELGFLDYVRAREKKGAKHLFDLPKGGSKKLSEHVNRYLDKMIVDDRRYVFHSLRHEFADRSEVNISVEVSKKIMGHARGRLYGLGAPLHHAAKELEKLDLSFIDWDRLIAAAGRKQS